MSQFRRGYIQMNHDLPGPMAVGGIVHRGGADTDEEFLRLLAMIQTLSAAKDAYELFEMAAKYTADGPISGEAHSIVVISTGGLGPGEYRIVRRLVSVPRRRQIVEVDDEEWRAASHKVGFIASVLRKRQPELLQGLSLAGDPVLGADFADFDSCLLLPIFTAGKLTKRVLLFRRGWDEVDYEHVERVTLLMNLIETSIENISIAKTNQELARILESQFEHMSRIQRQLIPRTHPEIPGAWEHHGSIPGLEIGMAYRSAYNAGGDYFDFFTLPDGQIGVLIADVSGHGADAAMVMGMLHAMVRSGLPLSDGPAAVLRALNAKILPLMNEGRFVTACCTILHPDSGRVVYCSAGHPLPRVRRAADRHVECLEAEPCDVLALLPDSQYVDHAAVLNPGDTMLLYTDGLMDSLDPEHSGEGVARLDKAMSAGPVDAPALAVAMEAAVIKSIGQGEPIDDVTLVLLRRTGGR